MGTVPKVLKKRSISEFVFRSLEASIHRTALVAWCFSGFGEDCSCQCVLGFKRLNS